ncbi:MAG: PD40 domain-containing protein [Verrucomicrobia bacterium]|nr:PD40 domain-containing protein [Cytophagales bacterium]
MSLRTIVIVFFLTFGQQAYSQSVQWASKMLEFSSEYGEKDYAALNVLGSPTTMPGGGSSVLAWCPKDTSNREFVKVGFKTPKFANRVIVAENAGAGSIRKISLFDNRFTEHIVYTAIPKRLPSKSRLLQATFPMTNYPVMAVLVEIDASLSTSPPQIDAIGISDAANPLTINVNTAPDIKFDTPPVNLSNAINSPYHEVYPIISPDGRTLYFARFDHPGNTGGVKGGMDIWVSTLMGNDKWSPARNAGFPLNGTYPKENNYVVSVQPDGNTLLVGNKFTPSGKIEKGVSFAYRNGNNWTTPKGVEIENFYNNSTENSFCLANDGKTLLMGIERDDSQGRQDLYVSFRKPNGIWSEPQNLGADINTLGNEFTPFLAADGVTLYFSSNGYPTYGDYDIYMTRRLDDTWKKWSKPQNLGPVINTSGWDAYYTVPASGDFAYFVSTNNSFGGNDIYKVALPNSLRPQPVVLVSGKVLNAKTKLPVSAEVVYESFADRKQAGIARSNNVSGDYKITLPAGATYGFLASAKGYIAINENIDLSKISSYKEISKDLYLVPIEAGQTIALNNIFFSQGKFDLLSPSYPELNRVADMMKENPTMLILIEGHTDYVGNPLENMKLSENRVKAVKEYLVKTGIVSKRIETKAFGGTQPLIRSSDENERIRNRRVEFSILKK